MTLAAVERRKKSCPGIIFSRRRYPWLLSAARVGLAVRLADAAARLAAEPIAIAIAIATGRHEQAQITAFWLKTDR